jgi:hypothetical protein
VEMLRCGFGPSLSASPFRYYSIESAWRSLFRDAVNADTGTLRKVCRKARRT